MVNQTIHGTFTETYDLNTLVGELSILGIHTPTANALKSMFAGYFSQYKKFKILGCNIQLACASHQELTPLEVGLEAGQMDARDVLNPVMFKACTGESLNILLDQIYNKSEEVMGVNPLGVTSDPSSVGQHIDNRDLARSDYYKLLADDSFRKAHPQAGMTIMGLKPMVHKVVTTQPFKYVGAQENTPYIQNEFGTDPDAVGFGGPSGTKTGLATNNPSVFVSDGITEMPWLDTTFTTNAGTSPNLAGQVSGINSVPRVYMGLMLLPPTSMPMYYRMTIVWHILFRDFRPSIELTLGTDVPATGIFPTPGQVDTYFNMYHTAGAKHLTRENGSFDATDNTSVSVINQAVR